MTSTVLAGSVVARIDVDLVADGSLSVSGNVGDVHLALGMIDSAADAIESTSRTTGLVLPGSYVEAPANERIYPLVAVGDQAPAPRPVGSFAPGGAKKVSICMMDNGQIRVEAPDVPASVALKMLALARPPVAARLGRPSVLEPHGAGLPYEPAPTTRLITP